MVSLRRYQLPAVVVVLVGVGVGVAGVGQAYGMMQSEERYLYWSEQVEASTIPADATVTQFQDLSPAAQEIFLTVQEREDTYSTTRQADDLQYDDDDVLMDGYNYVRYEGDSYRFYAGVETGSGLGALLYLVGGLASAGVLGALGVASWTYDLVKLPVSVVSGLAVLSLGIQTAGVALVTVGGGVAAMVLTWVALSLVDRHSSVTIEPAKKTR